MAMNRFPVKALLAFALLLTAALLSLKQQSKPIAHLGDPPVGGSPLVDPGVKITREARSRPASTLGISDQFGRNDVLEQLALADRQWVPKAERLANGSTRFSYKRHAGEPSLSIEQIRDLMENPPTFSMERQSISRIWQILERAGVDIRLAQPRKDGAAGEWDANARTLRIQPELLSKGSKEFARVLNHEAIHVAQSCKRGSITAYPELIGLPNNLPPALEFVLQKPQYRNTSLLAKGLEREAFANQADLDIGPSLLQTYCF
jgi:hypothetical protein